MVITEDHRLFINGMEIGGVMSWDASVAHNNLQMVRIEFMPSSIVYGNPPDIDAVPGYLQDENGTVTEMPPSRIDMGKAMERARLRREGKLVTPKLPKPTTVQVVDTVKEVDASDEDWSDKSKLDLTLLCNRCGDTLGAHANEKPHGCCVKGCKCPSFRYPPREVVHGGKTAEELSLLKSRQIETLDPAVRQKVYSVVCDVCGNSRGAHVTDSDGVIRNTGGTHVFSPK